MVATLFIIYAVAVVIIMCAQFAAYSKYTTGARELRHTAFVATCKSQAA